MNPKLFSNSDWLLLRLSVESDWLFVLSVESDWLLLGLSVESDWLFVIVVVYDWTLSHPPAVGYGEDW